MNVLGTFASEMGTFWSNSTSECDPNEDLDSVNYNWMLNLLQTCFGRGFIGTRRDFQILGNFHLLRFIENMKIWRGNVIILYMGPKWYEQTGSTKFKSRAFSWTCICTFWAYRPGSIQQKVGKPQEKHVHSLCGTELKSLSTKNSLAHTLVKFKFGHERLRYFC